MTTAKNKTTNQSGSPTIRKRRKNVFDVTYAVRPDLEAIESARHSGSQTLSLVAYIRHLEAVLDNIRVQLDRRSDWSLLNRPALAAELNAVKRTVNHGDIRPDA